MSLGLVFRSAIVVVLRWYESDNFLLFGRDLKLESYLVLSLWYSYEASLANPIDPSQPRRRCFSDDMGRVVQRLVKDKIIIGVDQHQWQH